MKCMRKCKHIIRLNPILRKFSHVGLSNETLTKKKLPWQVIDCMLGSLFCLLDIHPSQTIQHMIRVPGVLSSQVARQMSVYQFFGCGGPPTIYRHWAHVPTYRTDVFVLDMLSSISQAGVDKSMKPMAFYYVYFYVL